MPDAERDQLFSVFTASGEIQKLNKSSGGRKAPRKERSMFKKFIQRIIEAKNRQDAIDHVFYGADGIDQAYQHEKITWKEHQMLLALIEKMGD